MVMSPSKFLALMAALTRSTGSAPAGPPAVDGVDAFGGTRWIGPAPSILAMFRLPRAVWRPGDADAGASRTSSVTTFFAWRDIGPSRPTGPTLLAWRTTTMFRAPAVRRNRFSPRGAVPGWPTAPSSRHLGESAHQPGDATGQLPAGAPLRRCDEGSSRLLRLKLLGRCPAELVVDPADSGGECRSRDGLGDRACSFEVVEVGEERKWRPGNRKAGERIKK